MLLPFEQRISLCTLSQQPSRLFASRRYSAVLLHARQEHAAHDITYRRKMSLRKTALEGRRLIINYLSPSLACPKEHGPSSLGPFLMLDMQSSKAPAAYSVAMPLTISLHAVDTYGFSTAPQINLDGMCVLGRGKNSPGSLVPRDATPLQRGQEFGSTLQRIFSFRVCHPLSISLLHLRPL